MKCCHNALAILLDLVEQLIKATRKKNECKDRSKEMAIKYIRINLFNETLCNKHTFKLFMIESLTELLVIMIVSY